ncbi:peptidase domain-containing ABC transporter [Cellvibrio sp. UBA7671]|uniref:peptidase domain-containing ABC transporter n=1 Tax=Cellvibrio sp. UBA7671 TaxID=1946312 RepID=UPI002F3521A6
MIFQSETSECGIACTAMILKHFGHDCSIESLRAKVKDRTFGISLREMVEILSSYNVQSRPIRIEVEDLTKITLPSILHWNMNHYVVVDKVNRNGIRIKDPSHGVRWVGLKELDGSFTGVCLEPSFDDALKIPAQNGKSKNDFFVLLESLRKSYFTIFVVIILSILIQFLTTKLPVYIQKYIDAHDSIDSLPKILLALLTIGFLINLSEFMRARLINYLSGKIHINIITAIVGKLFNLPVEYFRKRSVGSMLSRIGSINEIRRILTDDVISIFVDSIFLLFALYATSLYSPKLTLILVVSIVLMVLLQIYHFRNLDSAAAEEVQALSNCESSLIESIQSIESLKSSASDTVKYTQWKNHVFEATGSEIKFRNLKALVDLQRGIIVSAEIALLIVVSISLMGKGEITIGIVMAFITLRVIVSLRVIGLLNNISNIRLIGIHLSRVRDIMYEEEEVFGDHKIEKGNIELENIYFGYGNNTIFNGMSLTIENESHVAVIGGSGSGKTTFVNLICGLVQPSEGSIKIGGIPNIHLGAKSLRKEIGLVLQGDKCIFEGTFIDNITMFEPNPNLEHVRNVINICLLDDVVSKLPNDIRSMMPNGNMLSGGQVQRIMIARAIYREPKILIMDEATNNLDAETEKKLLENINKLNFTKISITHRNTVLSHVNSTYKIVDLKMEKIDT